MVRAWARRAMPSNSSAKSSRPIAMALPPFVVERIRQARDRATRAASRPAGPAPTITTFLRTSALGMSCGIVSSRPVAALWACLLFGFFQSLALRPDVMQAVGIKIPGPALDALPYILTVVVLAGLVGKAIPPRAGGEPYVKER